MADVTLYFATGNQHKIEEAKAGLPGVHVEQVDPPTHEIMDPSVEVIARRSIDFLPEETPLPVFVEDSGVYVDALEGFPGPISGYAFRTLGPDRILNLLSGVSNRGARFLSAIALKGDGDKIRVFTGQVSGEIVRSPRGEHGFDYDPLFKPTGSDRTLGQMAPEEKNRFSHRGRALKQLYDYVVTM